jgi:Cu+-exporting ATPase
LPVTLPVAKGSPWFTIAVGAVLAGQAMLLSLAVNLAPPSGAARWLLHGALMFSSVAALAILGRPLLQCAIEDLTQRRVSIEFLFLAGIGGALGASLYSTLAGVGAVYYEVVAVLLTVYSVGRTLGTQSRARALAETRHLQHAFETCQKVGLDGSTVTVRVAEIRAGDQVRVLAGEPIPIDGRIVTGQAFVCETPLTGEPFPVVRRAGDAVLAGSYSEDGELRIAAGAPGTSRRLDELLAALETARERPCRIQAQADRLVRWFLPVVLAVSAGTFVFWTWRTSWAIGLFNSLAVLLVACPCAMGLATPVALWSALAALAARGLVVRSGDVIERLAGLDRMIFDKTGTLSEEKASLIDLATLGSASERREITRQLCAVQTACAHPVARAFDSLDRDAPGLHHAGDGRNPNAFRTISVKPIPACGVEAWVESEAGEEHYLRIGQREFMTELTAETQLVAMLRSASSDHLVFVEVDGRLRAIAAVRERLRVSAREARRLLETQGIGCAVMTGDSAERAGQLLGADQVLASLTPQDKAKRIDGLKKVGYRVGFAGDGVNDAPAINAATVGIALAHGAGVTTASADAVLYGGDLRVVPWAVALCRRVRNSIRSNLIFAAVYNGLGIALAATGLLHPVAAALLMVVSSFTVSWRALRSAESDALCCAPPVLASGGESCASETLSMNLGGWVCNLLLQVQQKVATARSWPVSRSERNKELPLNRWFGVPPLGGERTQNPLKPGPRTRWRLGSWLQFVANKPTRLSTRLPEAGVVIRSRWQWVYAMLVIAQAPFLAYLGQLDTRGFVPVSAALLGLGIFIACFRTGNAERYRFAHMTFAMLGPGNWGMILGWWADAGFLPVGLGGQHCEISDFSLLSFANMPWMNLGMLFLGLPPMVLAPTNRKRGWGGWPLALLSAVGMVWGMSFGNHAFMKWLGPQVSNRFLLSFAGMTLGMLLGMFLGCEVGRAISLSWRRRQAG